MAVQMSMGLFCVFGFVAGYARSCVGGTMLIEFALVKRVASW